MIGRKVIFEEKLKSTSAAFSPPLKKRRGNFIERTLTTFVRKAERALFAEQIAKTDGFLQSLDPRIKIVGLLALIVDVTLARNIFTILFIFAFAILLTLLSNIPIKVLAARAWLGAFTFTGLIALPVIFITPGEAILRVPLLNWIISAQGVTSALYLLTRVETTVTLSLLLILSTLWTQVLKALRVLRVPIVFVVILGMTYRYLFVILETARDMFEARRSRLVGRLTPRESRRLASSSIGVLLSKSFYLNTEVYQAMQSRGFRGEVYTLDEFEMRPKDWLVFAGFLLIAIFALWLGQHDSFAVFIDKVLNFVF